MNASSFSRKYIVPLVFGLVASIGIVSTVGAATITDTYDRFKMQVNCATLQLPAVAEKQLFLDPDNNVVVLTWYQGEKERQIELPFNPEKSFSGCSQSAQAILMHVKENNDKLVADSCADFKSIISGERPMQSKGGEMPNIEGAKNFVATHCN